MFYYYRPFRYTTIGQSDALRRAPVRTFPAEARRDVPQAPAPEVIKRGIDQLSPGLRFIAQSVWNNRDAVAGLLDLFTNMFAAREYSRIPITFVERQAFQELTDRYNQLMRANS